MIPQREPDPTLLTGASGYVGGFLISELLRRGRRVRVVYLTTRSLSCCVSGYRS